MSTETAPTAQRLATAIEQLEKLTRMAEQLPARLESAKAEVVRILGELGIEAKPAKRAKMTAGAPKSAARRAPGGEYVPPEGSLAEAILAQLPGSIPGIAGALEEPNLRGVAVSMSNMERRGHVVRDETTDPPIFRLATEADRAPLAAAALDTAGVEAA